MWNTVLFLATLTLSGIDSNRDVDISARNLQVRRVAPFSRKGTFGLDLDLDRFNVVPRSRVELCRRFQLFNDKVGLLIREQQCGPSLVNEAERELDLVARRQQNTPCLQISDRSRSVLSRADCQKTQDQLG